MLIKNKSKILELFFSEGSLMGLAHRANYNPANAIRKTLHEQEHYGCCHSKCAKQNKESSRPSSQWLTQSEDSRLK